MGPRTVMNISFWMPRLCIPSIPTLLYLKHLFSFLSFAVCQFPIKRRSSKYFFFGPKNFFISRFSAFKDSTSIVSLLSSKFSAFKVSTSVMSFSIFSSSSILKLSAFWCPRAPANFAQFPSAVCFLRPSVSIYQILYMVFGWRMQPVKFGMKIVVVVVGWRLFLLGWRLLFD